ncbi:MAG: hypothetical protein WBM29_06900 [Candidatus Deferrimicrobium sp.]
MKTKLGAAILTGVFLVASALTAVAGGPAGRGNMRGTALQTRDQTRTSDRIQARQRLRDGSCVDPSKAGAAGETMKRGNTYGPGDGTGPSLPKNGTGFGAPSNR